MTTGAQVIARFTGRSDRAAHRLAAWRSDPSKAEVVPVVEDHIVRVLYDQTPDAVLDVCRRTEHALGNVSKEVVSQVESVRDWHPNFAFTHVLHLAVESTGKLPTFGEFRAFCREQPVGQATLWRPAQEMLDRVSLEGDRSIARDAIRWRIGNAYYSFLREAYVLAVLRASGLLAEVHPLADALFRVDLWVGEVNVSLYIGNIMFRSGAAGRKDRPEELLGDGNPPFRFHSIQLPTQHRFGDVHLPERARIEQSAIALARLAGQ